LIVHGATLFGEVVDLKQQSLVFPGKPGDDVRDEAIFPKRVIVEMPEVGRAAEGGGGSDAERLCQGFGGVITGCREVFEAGNSAVLRAR
jgi:hypothetical protein